MQYLPAVVGTVVLWLALMVFAATRPGASWTKALAPAFITCLIATAITFFITPAMTKSSFANMGYRVDLDEPVLLRRRLRRGRGRAGLADRRQPAPQGCTQPITGEPIR